ncbi:serine hydrolase domain-containing protein [Microlunatus flavus]|uniref:CubicO group peptidase, beta-lactamase class C family n=1 Tax=Microlunatus flavus TaxID=1036181 RepID=A0A1H9DEF9_9ACTN|nr:serine hydrolase [Microlunatus flavus]SEQ11854.1 CubicO group peptidase, beta-lactamase class C family [Microlunatus flavus]
MDQPDPTALPVARPSEVALDAAGVTAFLDAVEATDDLELHSLALVRHGRVCAQGWWDPYVPDDKTLLYSLSKSFTSTALGFAVAEGRLALTDRVVDRLAPRGEVGSRTAALTLADLAAMATGHHADTLERANAADPDDLARGFLTLEPESDPGSVFAYNNPSTHTLGAVVQEVTGQTLTDYLRPRLFEPLGVEPGWWDQHPEGRDIGFTGFHLTTGALARFGQLYLADGAYAGHQVLPEGWAGLALAEHTPNPAEPNPDWRQGYGFQFWRGRHGTVRGDGAFGQFVVLMPEQDAVLVLTGATENMQGVLDAAWAHLLPAFDRPASATAEAELADRLDRSALVTDRGLRAAASSDLEVLGVEETADGWLLRLAEDGRELGVEVGREVWRRSDVAVADGWGALVAARGHLEGADGSGTLVADLVLVESPHRLRVRTGPGGSEVVWHTAPLGHGRLRRLATPRR